MNKKTVAKKMSYAESERRFAEAQRREFMQKRWAVPQHKVTAEGAARRDAEIRANNERSQRKNAQMRAKARHEGRRTTKEEFIKWANLMSKDS